MKTKEEITFLTRRLKTRAREHRSLSDYCGRSHDYEEANIAWAEYRGVLEMIAMLWWVQQ